MKKGFVASCFDLGPHAGHIAMLEEAKRHCDHLIVALQTDPTLDRKEKNSPVESVSERYLKLKACKYVDEIIPYSTEMELRNLLYILWPGVRFLGTEYMNRPFTGSDLDIPIHWIARHHSISSSNIRSLIWADENARLEQKRKDIECHSYQGSGPQSLASSPSLSQVFKSLAGATFPLEMKTNNYLQNSHPQNQSKPSPGLSDLPTKVRRKRRPGKKRSRRR